MTQPYNDTLEAYEDMSEQISTLQAQRDDLLAVLEGFMWLADDYAHGHNEASRKLSANIAQARAAIRRARGEN